MIGAFWRKSSKKRNRYRCLNLNNKIRDKNEIFPKNLITSKLVSCQQNHIQFLSHHLFFCIKWKNFMTVLLKNCFRQKKKQAMKIIKNEYLHTFVHQWILSNHLKLMRKFSLFSYFKIFKRKCWHKSLTILSPFPPRFVHLAGSVYTEGK